MKGTTEIQDAALTAAMRCIEMVTPDTKAIERLIDEVRAHHPQAGREQLAEAFADKICRLYAQKGALLAAPACLPGFGTTVQLFLEGGALTVDTVYLIHYMATMVKGLAKIHDKDIDTFFNDELVKVIAAWCGVVVSTKGELLVVGQEIFLTRFKKAPRQVFLQMNRRVGKNLIAKYGSRRLGVAVGTLVPFGVGMAIAGGFNWLTMRSFKAEALAYFRG